MRKSCALFGQHFITMVNEKKETSSCKGAGKMVLAAAEPAKNQIPWLLLNIQDRLNAAR